MTAEPATITRLVATLDQDRMLSLDEIPAEDIAHLVSRIVPPERLETTLEVAAFNSAI